MRCVSKIVAIITLMLPVSLAVADECAEWTEVSSDRFTLATPLSAERAGAIAQKFGYFEAAIDLVTGVKGSPPLPIRVFVVNSSSWTRQFGTQLTGLVHNGRFETDLLMVDPQFASADPFVGAMHEYVHHVLQGQGAFAYPAWYSEGLAEILSASRDDETTFSVGLIWKERIGVATGNWIALRKLMNDFGRGQEHRPVSVAFLGEAALLTHYLTFSTQHKDQLARYLKAASQGADLDAAFTTAFNMTYEQLEAQLRAYAKEKIFASYRLPKSMLVSTYKSAAIPCWRGRIATGLALLRLTSPQDMNATWLNLDDRTAYRAAWRLARATAYLAQRDFVHADLLMDEVAGMQGITGEYLVQLALLRIEEVARRDGAKTSYPPEEVEMLKKTRALLETPQVQSLDTTQKAYALASLDLLLGERIGAAAQIAIHGVELSPKNPDMALLAALACERNKDMDNAAGALSIVAAYSRQPSARQLARKVLADIDAHPQRQGYIAASYPLISAGDAKLGRLSYAIDENFAPERDYGRPCQAAEISRDSNVLGTPAFTPPHSDRRYPLAQPVYPADLRRDRVEGTVVVAIRTNETGFPSRAVVTRSSGYDGLDKATLDVIDSWRLQPALLDGRPVCAWNVFSVTFSIH